MKQRVLKKKKCKQCGKTFTPERPIQPVCDYSCAIAYARDQQSKKLKAENKVKLRGMMTKGAHLKELQTVFNRFIRLRDKDLPCISCGSMTGKRDSGHYYSVGSYPNLRLNEDNAHSQCVHCNQHKHGAIQEYAINLPLRIGEERFEALANMRSTPLRLSIPEIIELKQVYRNKIKELTR